MQIVKSNRYLEELETMLGFIAKDSLNRALQFADTLNAQVMELDIMPYKHRASFKSNDISVRDLVFKGYVIPYRINKSKNRIEILGIFNQNQWELQT